MAKDERDDWRVVLGPGPVNEIRQQLARWLEANGEVSEEDIRLDLIRSTGGDQMRVRLRGFVVSDEA